MDAGILRRLPRWAGILAVGSVVLVVLTVALFIRGSTPLVVADQGWTADTSGGSQEPGQQTAPVEPTLVGAFADVVWDLEYDDGTGEIWLVVGNDDEAALGRLDANGVSMVAKLPPAEYSGVHHKVRLLESGDVVLNGDYSLVRFETATSQLRALEFSLEEAEALPGALDRDNPLPGTWISAFDVVHESIYVARNNVPAITVVDSAGMKPTRLIPIPANYAGARGLIADENSIYLLSPNGLVGRFLMDGSLAAEEDSHGIGIARLGFEVSLAQQIPARRLDLGAGRLISADVGHLVYTSPTAVGDYDSRTGSFTVYVERTANTGTVVLPALAVPDRGEDWRAGASAPPNLADFVFAPDGTIWFSRADSGTLWKVSGQDPGTAN